MTVLVNLGTGSSDGTAVTTGNSGGTGSNAFDNVTTQANTSAFWELDNRWPDTSLGILFTANASAGQAAFTEWSTSFIPSGTVSSQINASCSLYFTALPGLAGSNTVPLIRALQSGNQRWRVGLQGDGSIRVSGDGEAQHGISSTTLSTNTLYFIEVGATGSTSASIEVRLYNSSGALIETIGPFSGVNNGGPVNQVRYGVAASINPSSNTSVYLSRFTVGNEGWLGPPGVAEPSVGVGPTSGGVTPASAKAVWTLADAAGLDCRMVVSTDPGLAVSPVYSSAAPPDSDGVFMAEVTGLSADTVYHYGVEIDGDIQPNGRGIFRTFPPEGEPGNFVVAFGSCQITNQDSDTFDLIRTYTDPTYGLSPLLMIHHGDYGYPDWDSAIGAAVVRAHYEQQIKLAKLGMMHAALPWSYTPNNHDWAAQPCDKDSPSGPSVAQAFRQYIPQYPLPAADNVGFWHSFVIRRVRFIVLDMRSQRDPQANTDNSSKSMLGADQLAWFEMELQAPEPLKVIISDPWRGAGAGSGRWGAYTYEFNIVNNMIDTYANGRVIVASGDRHALAADDGSSSATRGRPNVVGAPINQGSTQDFETWSHGYWYSYQEPPVQENVDAAGFMLFVDDGNSIDFLFRGLTSDGIERISYAQTFETSVTTSLGLAWDTRAEVAESNALSFDTRSIVEQDLGLEWNAAAITEAAVEVLHDVFRIAAAELGIEYNVSAVTQETLGLLFDSYQSTQAEIDLGWDAYELIELDLDIDWETSAQAVASNVLRFDTSAIASSAAGLAWDTYSIVSEDLEILYEIRESGVTARMLQIRYNTYARVVPENQIRFNTHVLVESDSEIRWDVLRLAESGVELRWDTVGRTVADLDLLWVVEGEQRVTVTVEQNTGPVIAHVGSDGPVTIAAVPTRAV